MAVALLVGLVTFAGVPIDRVGSPGGRPYAFPIGSGPTGCERKNAR
jgi:hypothetical protein